MSQQDHIDRFLSNKMSAEERASFEKLMQNDPLLAREVEETKRALQKLKNLERLTLKTRLQNIESNLENQEERKKIFPFIWLILILAIMGILLWYNSSKNESPPTVPIETLPEPDSNVNHQNIEISPVDTAAESAPVQPEPKKEKVMSKAKREEIFAAHFEPYTDDDIEYEVRSNQEKTAFELYKHYYINGKYDKALVAFENLDPGLQNDEQVLFIKANVYMAKGHFDQALQLLHILEKNKTSPYEKDIQWFLALCYVRTGELQKAKSILSKAPMLEMAKSKKLLEQL